MTVRPPPETSLGNEEQPTGEYDAVAEGVSRAEQDMPPEHQPLPKDVLFGLLSAKRRRDVLEYMVENGPETTLSDLAEHIAAQENDTEIRLLNSQQRKRVYVALYQCHLPKMDDADVIEFEQARGTVERRPNAAQLYRYLDVNPVDSDGTGTQDGMTLSERLSAVTSKLGGWVPKST